jgi:hypothetical protein
LLHCHWRALFSFERLATEEMLIVGCLEEILGGDGEEILGGDVGELTVFPLGPGNGEEPE